MRLWTAVRLQTRILDSLCRRAVRPYSGPVAREARQGRHSRTSQGLWGDIKGGALGWFGRVRRMRASDCATAIEVIALATWVEIALKIMPVSQLLERVKQRSLLVAASGDEYQRLHRFVAIAYEVLPFPATCLRRSVVLHALLERRGVPSRVCFGVAKNGVVLDAHAWVECDGITTDASHVRFNQLTPATESAEITGSVISG